MALFVFALLTVLFASSLVLSTTASGMNGQYAQALSLCQHKMDQLRAVGYGRLDYIELNDAGIVDASPSASPYRFMTQDSVGSLLQNASTSLAIVPLASDARVKVVTVTISWKASSGRTTNSTASLVGYIANTE
jgi:hypothetical protein